MERLWPKEDVLPLFQFYMAQSIEDLLSSREEVVVYSLKSFLEHHRATKSLSFMIHSDNLLKRAMHVSPLFVIPHVPSILLDRSKKPSLYRLTATYVFLPRIQHTQERDSQVKAGEIVLFDSSSEVKVCFPERSELARFEQVGWLNAISLKENAWQSGVILRCTYTSGGDKYTLVQVFNKWAIENQERVLQEFVDRLAPKFAR